MRIPAASLALLSVLAFARSGAPAQEGPPELLGTLTQQELFEALPAWQDRMVAYEPRLDAVAALKEFGEFVQIEVFLGTWCSDSAAQIPPFIQVMNLVNAPQFEVTYIGVPEAQEARTPYIAGKDLGRIPTFIVYVNGLEKGRIEERPAVTIEEDLLDILRR
jgi:thiol-disulfide isomerase/thioredoxin